MTGYVRLDSTHRSHEKYLELGQRLIGLGLPTVAYHQPLDACWLARHHEAMGVAVEADGKDSLAYHCVQHEKTAWLARAARQNRPSTLIWIDYGILHVPGVTEQLVHELWHYVDANPPTRVTIPSIWPADAPIDDQHPCWICAGGILVMPSFAAQWWHSKCMAVATHSRPTWEVNTWAKVSRQWPQHVTLYKADHDATLLTGIAA